jgi:hypothetical protein
MRLVVVRRRVGLAPERELDPERRRRERRRRAEESAAREFSPT